MHSGDGVAACHLATGLGGGGAPRPDRVHCENAQRQGASRDRARCEAALLHRLGWLAMYIAGLKRDSSYALSPSFSTQLCLGQKDWVLKVINAHWL